MTSWDDLSALDETKPFDWRGAFLTWLACGCIWAIHLTTYPFARSQYAGRSKAKRDAINLHNNAANNPARGQDHAQ